jgi:hypothetical protein
LPPVPRISPVPTRGTSADRTVRRRGCSDPSRTRSRCEVHGAASAAGAPRATTWRGPDEIPTGCAASAGRAVQRSRPESTWLRGRERSETFTASATTTA